MAEPNWICEYNGQRFVGPHHIVLKQLGDYRRSLPQEELIRLRDENVKIDLYLEGTAPGTPIQASCSSVW